MENRHRSLLRRGSAVVLCGLGVLTFAGQAMADECQLPTDILMDRSTERRVRADATLGVPSPFSGVPAMCGPIALSSAALAASGPIPTSQQSAPVFDPQGKQCEWFPPDQENVCTTTWTGICPIGEPAGSPRCHDVRALRTVWPCTCTLRINTPGSPADHCRSKKSYKRGLS
jgi:hypothetical protein